MNINESRWINPTHGMELHPDINTGNRQNENGILFLAEYEFLKYELSQMFGSDVSIFNAIAKNLRTYKPNGVDRYEGLFDRGSGESLTIPKEEMRTISHDNITAIVAFSAMFHLGYHEAVFKHGKRNFWRFDNVYPEAPRWSRIMHPRDIIHWSRLGGGVIGKSLAWSFMWLFYVSQIWSALDKSDKNGNINTSGPLLIFVRLFPLRRKSIVARGVWWLCQKIRKFYHKREYDFMFEYYFNDEQHPNRLLAKEVFTK